MINYGEDVIDDLENLRWVRLVSARAVRKGVRPQCVFEHGLPSGSRVGVSMCFLLFFFGFTETSVILPQVCA